MANAPPRIITDRLVLRLPEVSDARAILAYYEENRDHLSPWEPARSASFYTLAHWEEQATRAARDWRDDLALRLHLFDRERPREMVGYIGFSGITRGVAQFCFMGYSIAARRQGTGLMLEAAEAALGHVFGPLRLRRVMANYMPSNHRSARLLERLGFAIEGYAREYLLIDGKWQDHVLTSKTNPRW